MKTDLRNIYVYDTRTLSVRELPIYKKGLEKFVDYGASFPLSSIALDESIKIANFCYF